MRYREPILGCETPGRWVAEPGPRVLPGSSLSPTFGTSRWSPAAWATSSRQPAFEGGGRTARRGYTEWFATAAVTHPISPQPATGSTGGPAPVRAYMEELLPGILEGTPGPHDP